MKLSEGWLREWVNPKLSTEALVEQLTMAGLEVDGLEAVAGEFTGVVVGNVVAAEQHPDADKLRLCTVDDGSESYTVVCGAPNARAGIRVAFARVGAALPGGIKIRKAKLRGVESFGMLCSVKELGLGDDHDGIIELPTTCKLGDDLRSALDLDDTSIDIDLTPNRGDCLSLRGVAREVGLLNNEVVTEPVIEPVAATIDASFPVTLSQSSGCPRYLGRVIKGIDPTAATPAWMVEKLRRSGIRSIDPTVDITNYVLLELGQPMHAFDLDVLQGGIDVRQASAGEKLTLLDGRDVLLDAQTLLITDGSGPVALAGVMGGERSGINSDTKNVFLECAYFSPLALAGTARRYGLHTDASQRYERGVDFELQEAAVERATRLLLDICGGEAGPTVVTEDRAALPVRREVSVAHSRLEQLLGVNIAPSEVDRAFEQLKFPVIDRATLDSKASDGNHSTSDVRWTIQAPSHRFDIEREADLVEEVCRVYGYNNIPARRPTTALALGTVALEQTSERRLRELLADMGYLETVTYSFVDPALQTLLDPGAPVMTLENPMSTELSTMRTTLLPGLLATLQNNAARQAQRLRLFEVGLCFCPDPKGKLAQELALGGLLWGAREPEGWSGDAASVDFFDAKGDVERLLEQLGVNSSRDQGLSFVKAVHPVFHPGQYAELVDGNNLVVGRVGRLHPEVEARMGGYGAIYAFELSAAAILRHATPQFVKPSKYPSVRRDLALVVDQGVAAAAIEAICRKTLDEKLVDFTFFDVYVGKGIDSNEKSIAVGLTLQAPSATLTDAEIGHFVQTVIDALANEVGARLR